MAHDPQIARAKENLKLSYGEKSGNVPGTQNLVEGQLGAK